MLLWHVGEISHFAIKQIPTVAVRLRFQQHYLNLISLLCSCFGSCHHQAHFPDSDPSFHLHFWHELTSCYKVWRIIIECIQGSRGVLLSGLNLMQSHLFNFTTREHLQVWGGRKQSDTERETLPVRLDRFNALATGYQTTRRNLHVCGGDVGSVRVIWACDDKCWFILRWTWMYRALRAAHLLTHYRHCQEGTMRGRGESFLHPG